MQLFVQTSAEYSCVFGAKKLYKKNRVQESMPDKQVSSARRSVQVSWVCVRDITVTRLSISLASAYQ